MTNKYFLFEDISSQWLEMAKEAKAGQEIFIFSPFITGSLITEVCKVALSNPVFVITSLKPDAYLGGSLDVGVLTDLLSKNVKVFHHSKLHAKLMLVGSKLTVGSQNFTDGGKYNEEASLVCDVSKDQIEILEKKITDLLKEADAIDKVILEKFVHDCENIREQYEEIQKMLEAVDVDIDEYFELGVQQRKPELQEVGVIKSNFGTHYVPIPVKVREKEYSLLYYGEKNIDMATYYTLVSTRKNEILNKFWKNGLPQIQENLEHLKYQMRYLCFELNSLQLFWVRANSSQIGKFGLGCTFTNWKSPDGKEPIRVILQNPYESEDFANIKIKFDTEQYGQINIGVLFTGTSFNLKSHSNKAKDKGGPVEVIKDWTVFWTLLIEPVLAELPSKILTPFNYKNERTGVSPTRLFKANQLMKLGLQKYEDKVFYILDDA